MDSLLKNRARKVPFVEIVKELVHDTSYLIISKVKISPQPPPTAFIVFAINRLLPSPPTHPLLRPLSLPLFLLPSLLHHLLFTTTINHVY